MGTVPLFKALNWGKLVTMKFGVKQLETSSDGMVQ